MLSGSLYTLQGFAHTENTVATTLILNPDHAIFQGHYPGQPVLPGACMLQVVKEVLQTAINSQIIIVKAGNIKFLEMINPVFSSNLDLSLSYIIGENNTLKVTANIKTYQAVGFKFQGIFRRV